MGILINNMKIIHTSTFTIIRTNAINGCRGWGGVHILQNMIGHVVIKSVIYTVQFAI